MRARRTSNRELVELMDMICFPEDDREDFDKSVWWTYRDDDGTPMGYCGLKLLTGPNSGVAYLCRAGVLPEYQGQGLQKRMISVRERYAREQGCQAILTYTITENYASITNLIKSGYRFYEPENPWSDGSVFFFIKYLDE